MALINPEANPELVLTLNIKEDDNQIVVKNTTSFDKTIALKLTNTYKIC